MHYFKSDFKRADMQTVNIFNHPKLKEAQAIRELTKALDNDLEKYFLYATTTNNKFIFWFNHQIGVLEFNSRKKQITSKMREIYKNKRLKDILYFTSIEAKLKNKSLKQEPKKQIAKDISSGNFQINCKNKQLEKIFKNIQKAIKENNKKAQNV